MIFLFLITLLPSKQSLYANDVDIMVIRKLFYTGTIGKKQAEIFINKMETLKNSTDPVINSYYGMALLLEAKHGLNPYTKLNNFKKGREILDNAVTKASQNVEIRFLRFSVQTNAPFFLNYNRNISADKAVILEGWPKLKDADLKSRIKIFMLNSSNCTNAERAIFK
jgi:hypothetical protein